MTFLISPDRYTLMVQSIEQLDFMVMFTNTYVVLRNLFLGEHLRKAG